MIQIWIINGDLCIIPSDKADETSDISSYSLSDALHFLNNKRSALIHPSSLQTAAFSRLSAYPTAAKLHIHRARVTVPRRVAQILHTNRSYIAPACEAFMLRDPISMRVCSSMNTFPPSDAVTCTIEFTRLMYAQMKAQRIVPPSLFKLPPAGSPEYDWAELGMKVACGFEMLCAGAGKSAQKKRRNDLPSDPRFNSYIGQLKKEGFFNAARPNSPKYNALMKEAQKTYLKICGDEYIPSEIGKQIVALLDAMPTATDDDIREWDFGQVENSDSWLDVDFDDFVKTMDSVGQPNNINADIEETERGEYDQLQGKAKNLFERLNNFVSSEKSGIDGLTFGE